LARAWAGVKPGACLRQGFGKAGRGLGMARVPNGKKERLNRFQSSRAIVYGVTASNLPKI